MCRASRFRAVWLVLMPCILLSLCVCAGCGGSNPGNTPDAAAVNATPEIADAGIEPPALADLEALLREQLAALGIDPDKHPASAPTAGNEVIDLECQISDPDGTGPEAPDGYLLTWTERLVGDYNMDGLVGVSDITPIAVYWFEQVHYDAPYFHHGIEDFPTGDPEYDGDVNPGEPPAEDSGAYNWRVARVDGDGNGEINVSELTPVGQHYGERLSGYRIYRRDPDEVSFELLMDPQQPAQPLLVSREAVNGGSGVDPRRPVRYSYHDEFLPEGEYEYRVVPYDAISDSEGPASCGGLEDVSAVQAVLTADVTQGEPPLTVQFDASSTTTLTGTIAAFLWDLNGDGFIDADTGLDPTLTHVFGTNGAWQVSVDVYNSEGESDAASVLISVTRLPVAKLVVVPDSNEVPLTATFDASGSFDHDGEVVRFEWDMDNDGVFELDTGPVPQRVLTLEEPGEVTLAVRVYDDCGAWDSTAVTHTLVDEYDEIEDNDSKAGAMQLGLFPVSAALAPLTGGIGPLYYDGDAEDWFAFEVESGATLSALLGFLHDDADLTLELYSSDISAHLARSATQSDGEAITARLPRAGRYYLRVLRAEGSIGGNALYTLSFQVEALTYDEVEDNDSASQPQDLGDISATLLPEFWGSLGPGGYDGDGEDWYRFSVDLEAGYHIALHFFHEDADLEMQLFDASGDTLIGVSHSVDDNETITAELLPGTYLLRCYWFEGDSANYWMSILFP